MADLRGRRYPVVHQDLAYATRLLEAGAELVDIQTLLGHANLATTQIYTYVSEGRMAEVVAKL